jgi:hypothetical protein
LRNYERIIWVVRESGTIKSVYGKDLSKEAYRMESIVLRKRRRTLYGFVLSSANFSLATGWAAKYVPRRIEARIDKL